MSKRNKGNKKIEAAEAKLNQVTLLKIWYYMGYQVGSDIMTKDKCTLILQSTSACSAYTANIYAEIRLAEKQTDSLFMVFTYICELLTAHQCFCCKVH